jgi:hypothetical protein
MTRRLPAILLLLAPLLARAEDHFLTIGGGGSPQNNQVSLERNVVYFRRTLADCGLAGAPHQVYFACGNEKARDLQFDDPNVQPPRANLLVARLWYLDDDLYHQYRPHDVTDLSGPATRAAITRWFATSGARLGDGDRLFIYFTGHGGPGNRQSPKNTTLDLWLDGAMTVKEFTALLDKLNRRVQVVLIMVQCHSGGFGGVLFPGGEAGPVLSEQSRCGFFATWSDRLAAGCTSDTHEADYKDYTTYFFAALSGKSRTGQPIPPPDYDRDGRTSLAEAHAYVLLTSDTIDLPIRTSDVLLRQFSKTKDDRVKDLVTPSPDFDALLGRATPERRAVLEGLAAALELNGPDKVAAARTLADSIDRQRKQLEPPRRGRPVGNRDNEANALRNQIRARVLARWPEMSNAYHPATIAALTQHADEVVAAIESHPAFKRWDEQVRLADERADRSFELERRWVKCQRLLYTAESVALEANLDKFAGRLIQSRYQALRAAENATFGKPAADGH